MFDPSRIQYSVNQARKQPDAERDQKLIGLMAMSMTEIRLGRGAVTERDLVRCGFTTDELKRLAPGATSMAADSWHSRNLSCVAA